MNKITLEALRNEIIGKDSRFKTPYGEKVITYADYTASGKPLKFVENYLLEVQKYYANSHTEDDVTGESMTQLLHHSEAIIKKEFNGVDNCSVIAAGTGATGAMVTFSKIVGLYMAPATKKLMLELPEKPEEIEMINSLLNRDFHENAPVVFIGPYEHHSNVLMWRESLAELVEIKLNDEGYLDLDDLKRQVSDPRYAGRFKIGSFSAGSNVTGVKTPVYEVAKILHQNDALACFDFAASGPYIEIDMNKDDESYFDAIYLSPHKMIGGPGSAGILMINNRIYDFELPPTIVGGGTVDYVSGFGHDYVVDIEEREKAGTPGILQIIKAALAIQLKGIIGVETIEKIEEDYMEQFIERFEKNKSIEILGPMDPKKRISIISFNVKNGENYFHPRYITTLLNDLFGIQSRAGCSCAGPYGHKLLGIDKDTSEVFRALIQKGVNSIKPGWVRINLHYSMAQETVDFLMDAIEFVLENAVYFLQEYSVDVKSGSWAHKNAVQDGASVIADFGIFKGFEMKDEAVFENEKPVEENVFELYMKEAAEKAEVLKASYTGEFTKFTDDKLRDLNWFVFNNASNNTKI